MSLYPRALAYKAAGLCPVPIMPGYKAPTWHTNGTPYPLAWLPYQERFPTDDELRTWFDHGNLVGIGLILGAVSGEAEALDIDDAGYAEQFLEQANYCGLDQLIARLVRERSPRQGMHLAYRCAIIAGNQKLATVLDAVDDPGKAHCVIETRGEGGFLVVAPSPPGIHPLVPQYGYELLRNTWEQIPTITPDERQALLDLARSFNTVVPVHQTVGRTSSPLLQHRPSLARPGDDLNSQATLEWWQALLEGVGWTLLYTTRQGVQHWQRPGKAGQRGASATLGACGPFLYVFSTNAAPLESDKAYAPFGAYAFLTHGGNFHAAALALRHAGYGGTPPVRPEIKISPDLPGIIDSLEAALLNTADDPLIYVHADRLCVLRRHHGVLHGIDRATGMPRIAALEEAHLLELASLTAKWLKLVKSKKKEEETWEEALPMTKAIQGLLARGQWQFAPLSGIITAPTLRPDGSYLDTPGYDPATGLYFEANGMEFPPPPAKPTIDDARSALGRLQEAVSNFPFEPPDQGFSSTIACLLTLLCRHMIPGNVPLFAFTATESRTGKSLLASVLALIAYGRPPAHYPQVEEDEERKRLLSVAMEGDSCVLIDNIAHSLGSPALDSILTAGTLGDRILGSNKIIKAPWTAVLMATGNNLSYKGDMAGRVVQIALDAKMERPEERNGFHHADLLSWVAQERGALVQAALTILRAYIEDGTPEQKLTPFGGFEHWSRRIRSALVWAGEGDPCPGRAALQQSADLDYENFASFLQCWEACYPLKTMLPPFPPQSEKLSLGQVSFQCRSNKAIGDLPPDKWDDLYAAIERLDKMPGAHTVNLKAVEHSLRKFQGRVIGIERSAATNGTHAVIDKRRLCRGEKPTKHGIVRWVEEVKEQVR